MQLLSGEMLLRAKKVIELSEDATVVRGSAVKGKKCH